MFDVTGSFIMESPDQRDESLVRMLRVWLWDGHEVRYGSKNAWRNCWKC